MTLDGGDVEDPDDEPYRPWLPPEDRLWRHPSEISATTAPAQAGWGPGWARSRPGRGRDQGMRRQGQGPAGSRRWPLVAVAGAVATVLAGGLVLATRSRPTGGLAARPEHAPTQRASAPGVGTTLALSASGPAATAVTTASVQASPSFMGRVARVFPSVVGIQVSSARGAWHGSGLLVRSDGMVLTAARLLVGASRITVVTSDGRTGSATVVGTDPDTDVAVIRFPAQGMTAATFTHDQTLVPGQMAVAVSVGQPGSKPAVSIGTVQAWPRPPTLPNGPPLLDVIETDAPLRSDAEGAALVNQDGQVIGMAVISSSSRPSSIASAPTTADAQPLWLVTPGALAWATAQQLMATGHVVQAWLGIEGIDAAPAAQPNQAPARNQPIGAKVTSVKPASPAAAADLEVGDVIQAINARPVSSMLALRSDLRLLSPGTRVELTVLRDSKMIALPAVLASR